MAEGVTISPASGSVPRAYDLIGIVKDTITKCGDVDTKTLSDRMLKTDIVGQSGHICFTLPRSAAGWNTECSLCD